MSLELEKFIHLHLSIPTQDLPKVTPLFKGLELKKNDYFLRSGAYAQRLGFIQSGMIREYFLGDGKEVTKWIAGPGYFIVDLESFLFDRQARWNLQALSDTQLFVIHKADYSRLGDIVPACNELEKRFIAKCFSVLEARIMAHLSMSAEERYEWLWGMLPELFQQVPLQYLASMLGMTPETFSRIRKKQSGSIS